MQVLIIEGEMCEYMKYLMLIVRCHFMQVLIIEGETGSGKTTQIPQYLHEAVSLCVISLCNNIDHCNIKARFAVTIVYLGHMK